VSVSARVAPRRIAATACVTPNTSRVSKSRRRSCVVTGCWEASICNAAHSVSSTRSSSAATASTPANGSMGTPTRVDSRALQCLAAVVGPWGWQPDWVVAIRSALFSTANTARPVAAIASQSSGLTTSATT